MSFVRALLVTNEWGCVPRVSPWQSTFEVNRSVIREAFFGGNEKECL